MPSRLDRGASDEFNGSAVAPAWQWVRPDAKATVGGGALRWPTEAADLTGTSNDAGILLRDPGAGAWTAETKVSIDLGTDTVRNFQQAGLIAYVNDDLFTRLSHVAIWDTRQTEFGKEMPYAGGLSYGGTIVGPPAATTWLRLTHRLDSRTGEHLLRAWTSTGRLHLGQGRRLDAAGHGHAQGRARLPRRRRCHRRLRLRPHLPRLTHGRSTCCSAVDHRGRLEVGP